MVYLPQVCTFWYAMDLKVCIAENQFNKIQ